MSTPAGNADTQGKKADSPAFSELVKQALEKATKDDKGNLVLPEGLSEEVQYAATAEKRIRDTQNGYTKLSQKTKALEAEKAILLNKVAGTVEITLTEAQAEELEELKFSDPEAWRKKLNRYEGEARSKQLSAINEELKQVSTTTLDNDEIERRKQVMVDFNRDHPEFKIDDDVIATDIPPRITKALADGSISFEQFLEDCYEYSKTGKVVKQEKVHNDPNLSRVGGGNSPDKNAKKEDVILSYNKETY